MATTLGRRTRHVLDVREPAAPLLHVPGGGHAGQVAELAHEVGVVGEPAGRGHVGDASPDDGSCRSHAPGTSSRAASRNRSTRPAVVGASPTWSRKRVSRCRRLQPVSSARVATATRPRAALEAPPGVDDLGVGLRARAVEECPQRRVHQGVKRAGHPGVSARRPGSSARAGTSRSSSAVIRLVSSEQGPVEQAPDTERGEVDLDALLVAGERGEHGPVVHAGEERGLPAAPAGTGRLQGVGPGQDQRAGTVRCLAPPQRSRRELVVALVATHHARERRVRSPAG